LHVTKCSSSHFVESFSKKLFALYPSSASRTLLELTCRKLKYYPTHFNAMSSPLPSTVLSRETDGRSQKEGPKQSGLWELSETPHAFQIRNGNETKKRRNVNANKS
jgi:hypothetical protein